MSTPVRVLVVDDEPLARAALAALLARDAEVELVATAADGRQALAALETGAPEVVFLDIEMPVLDGLELARAAGERIPRVVFVTAHAEHAVTAFDLAAVDYLLKPFHDARFARALERAKEAVASDRRGSTRPGRFPERLALPSRGGVSLVAVTEIEWIAAQDYCVEVHVAGRGYLLRKSLKELALELDPGRFVRIHRSSIVNVDKVARLEPAGHGERRVVLRDGTRLRLSRAYKHSIPRLEGRGSV